MNDQSKEARTDASNLPLSSTPGLRERLQNVARSHREGYDGGPGCDGDCDKCELFRDLLAALPSSAGEASGELPPFCCRGCNADVPRDVLECLNCGESLGREPLTRSELHPAGEASGVALREQPKAKCLLDADLNAQCVTHDCPCEWVECTGWRCDVSGEIVKETAPSPEAGRAVPQTNYHEVPREQDGPIRIALEMRSAAHHDRTKDASTRSALSGWADRIEASFWAEAGRAPSQEAEELQRLRDELEAAQTDILAREDCEEDGDERCSVCIECSRQMWEHELDKRRQAEAERDALKAERDRLQRLCEQSVRIEAILRSDIEDEFQRRRKAEAEIESLRAKRSAPSACPRCRPNVEKVATGELLCLDCGHVWSPSVTIDKDKDQGLLGSTAGGD